MRLYRRAYVEALRKSRKSSLASAVALYLAYGDDEAGPEIAFAAHDREQASICFNGARHMLEQVPELYAQTTIYNSRKGDASCATTRAGSCRHLRPKRDARSNSSEPA
jgi:phage terminase large subunit-like protein